LSVAETMFFPAQMNRAFQRGSLVEWQG